MNTKYLLILLQLIHSFLVSCSSNESLNEKLDSTLNVLEKFNNLTKKIEIIYNKQVELETNFNKKLNDLNGKFNAFNRRLNDLENKFNLYSLETNIPIDDLLYKGYKCVYNVTYGHITDQSELNTIKSSCNSKSILCAAGGEINSNKFNLVSCGPCLEILQGTIVNKPNLINGAYWYNTPSISFGFSSLSGIKQDTCDAYDCDASFKKCSDSKRLCWHLDGSGGWRIGELIRLTNSEKYFKYLLIRF